MIFLPFKWYFDINWHTFEKKWADIFQIYPNAIHLNPLQFCPSMPLLDFPVFCLSSSMALNCYFHILVNSMTIWSVLKLPKIAWPFNMCFYLHSKKGWKLKDVDWFKLLFTSDVLILWFACKLGVKELKVTVIQCVIFCWKQCIVVCMYIKTFL